MPGNATDKFHQLQLRFIDPSQRDDEVVRPMALFSERVAEHSRQVKILRLYA